MACPGAPRLVGFLEYFEENVASLSGDPMPLVLTMAPVPMPMTVTVAVARMFAAAQKPCACDVDREAESGNWDGLSEMDRNRCKQPRHRFVPNEQSYHCQNNGAGKPREIAKLTGPEM